MKRAKWIQREFKNRDYTFTFVEPEKSGYYWVTDGWYVHMAHYKKDASGEWGIYQPDSNGIMRYCYALDDMNFNIVGWCEMDYPTIPIKYQDM